MHRLYSASRPKSAAKIIKTISNNVQKGQNQKRPALGATVNKTVSVGDQIPAVFTRNVSVPYKAKESLSHRFSSGYSVHPEKLKQLLKERDGHRLCIYYDSDTYKQRARDIVEEQARVINVGPSRSLSDTDVTYEHILNCAQPRKKPKVIIDQAKGEPSVAPRPTIIPQLLKRKKKRNSPDVNTIVINYEPPSQQKITPKNSQRRIYRKRTTIMPVYLKKMQDSRSIREKASNTQTDEESEVKSKYVPPVLRNPMNINKSRYRQETQKPERDHKYDHSLTVGGSTYQKLQEIALLSKEKPRLSTLDWNGFLY